MTVNVRDALAGCFAVLDCDVEAVGVVEAGEGALDAGDCVEEVVDFGR
jgi:hypothetical protein